MHGPVMPRVPWGRAAGLTAALSLRERDVVAFVGAGGKTTAMFRLARELRASGACVVVTTTTRIFAPAAAEGRRVVLGGTWREMRAGVAAAQARRELPVVARAVSEDGKLVGVRRAQVARLAALPGVDHVLVEADGARGKPFKAPRRHEPVIPVSATLVVAVVGIDAVGRRLRAAAHDVAPVTAIAPSGADDPVDPRTIARVMLDPAGGAKGVPSGARLVFLINKADSAVRVDRARALSRELRRLGARRVVIAALRRREAIVGVAGDAGGQAREVAVREERSSR